MAANDSLNREDTLLLIALASGDTVAEAAEKAKMSERTAFRRLQDTDFQRQLSQLRGQMQARAMGALARIASDAVDTLEVLIGEDSPPTVRLGASRAILDLGARLREATEIEERVVALEAAVSERRSEKIA